jgi:hypothetical protein
MACEDITALAANKASKVLAKDFRRIFGPAHDVAQRHGSLTRRALHDR